MSEFKAIRWQQRFTNFEKSYKSLSKYIDKPIETELERAVLYNYLKSHLSFHGNFMKDYLEFQQLIVKSQGSN